MKKIEKALSGKNKGEAQKLLPLAQKSIDKAVKNGLLKKNTASRVKSKLASSIKKLA